MIVVTGTFKITDLMRAAAMQPVVLNAISDSRNEPGCLVYEFAQLIDDAQAFRIYEEWESKEALDAHMQTDHFKALSEALEKAGVTDLSVMKFEAGERTPLS
ncbi:unnamed protein product [Ectocarpus sp. 12 AP-2014]